MKSQDYNTSEKNKEGKGLMRWEICWVGKDLRFD